MAKHCFKVIILCLKLLSGLKATSDTDCFETDDIVDLNKEQVLTACTGSVIRFTILPLEDDSRMRQNNYTFRVFEGSSLSKELLLVENETFITSEKDILFTSHHHKVKLVGRGQVPFTLRYRYIPNQSSYKEIEFGKGKLQDMVLPSEFYTKSLRLINFINDRQKIILKTPGSSFSDPLLSDEKQLYDPEYLLTTIDTGNGRIGLLTTPALDLILRKIAQNTTLQFITGTRSRQTFNDDELSIKGFYDLGDRRTLSTISPYTSKPFQNFTYSSITLYFMSINELDFYKSKFTVFKTKLEELLDKFSKEESSYNTNCELQFYPPEGFCQCRKDCSLSETNNSNNGCGSISVVVKRNIAGCAVYSTQDFQERLNTLLEDLSAEFESNIQMNDCLSGTKAIMITSALPVFVVLIVFAIFYLAEPVKSIVKWRIMRVQRKKKLDLETSSNRVDYLSHIAKDNRAFFEEWPMEHGDEVRSTTHF